MGWLVFWLIGWLVREFPASLRLKYGGVHRFSDDRGQLLDLNVCRGQLLDLNGYQGQVIDLDASHGFLSILFIIELANIHDPDRTGRNVNVLFKNVFIITLHFYKKIIFPFFRQDPCDKPGHVCFWLWYYGRNVIWLHGSRISAFVVAITSIFNLICSV